MHLSLRKELEILVQSYQISQRVTLIDSFLVSMYLFTSSFVYGVSYFDRIKLMSTFCPFHNEREEKHTHCTKFNLVCEQKNQYHCANQMQVHQDPLVLEIIKNI